MGRDNLGKLTIEHKFKSYRSEDLERLAHELGHHIPSNMLALYDCVADDKEYDEYDQEYSSSTSIELLERKILLNKGIEGLLQEYRQFIHFAFYMINDSYRFITKDALKLNKEDKEAS